MKTAQAKLKKTVEDYIRLCPEEYHVFADYLKEQRHALADETYGVAEGSGNDMRALFEMPVTLHDMIVKSLNEEELAWFKYGGVNKNEGGRWFAVNFPAFRLPEKV